MRATLDLAVEFLARGGGTGVDEDRAVDAVRTVSVIRLFRLGVSLVGKVGALGQALRRRGPFAALAHLDLVEDPEATVLTAVTRARPLYACLLDDPPASGERPFGSLADIARATAAIERAAVAQAMLLGLGVRPEHLVPEALEGVTPSDVAEIDAGVLARTALVLLLSHKKLSASIDGRQLHTESFRALTPAEASGFGQPTLRRVGAAKTKKPATAPSTPSALADALRTKARQILERVSPPRMEAAAREMTDRWLETLSPLETVLVRPKRRGRPGSS